MRRMLKLATVTVLVALVFGVLPIQVGFGQDNQEEDAQIAVVDKLLDLFESAKDMLSTTLTNVETRKGEALPEVVWENYHTGLEKAAEAVTLRDADNYQDAKAKALEAMQKMKEVTLEVAEDMEEVETEDEQQARIAAGIEGAVERIETRIARLETVADKAEAQGIDASKIRERLALTRGLLSDIQGHIEAGDISEAAEEMELSQQEFGKAMAELRPVIEDNKIVQIGRYLDMSENRLSRVSDMITGILDNVPIPDIAKNRVTQCMQTAQDKITEVRSFLQEGRISDAMPKLGELRADISNLMAEVKQRVGPDVGEASENIDRYEIALDVLEDRAEILSERDRDISELSTKIQEARNLIQSAIENFKEGKLTDVENILAQIDVIIAEATSLADQLKAEAVST